MPTCIVAQPEMCRPLHFPIPRLLRNYTATLLRLLRAKSSPHESRLRRVVSALAPRDGYMGSNTSLRTGAFAIRPEQSRRIYWTMVLIDTIVQ
jgi:hypothetical protein